MNSLPQIPRAYIVASVVALIIGALVIVLLFSSSTDKQAQSQNQTEQTLKLSINDLESVYVHMGLDIPCPNIQGVSQNGYVYSAVLTGKKAAIERLGCGVGEPEVFAAAIAQDLELNGNFQQLAPQQVFEKMTFKFYDLNTSN